MRVRGDRFRETRRGFLGEFDGNGLYEGQHMATVLYCCECGTIERVLDPELDSGRQPD